MGAPLSDGRYKAIHWHSIRYHQTCPLPAGSRSSQTCPLPAGSRSSQTCLPVGSAARRADPARGRRVSIEFTGRRRRRRPSDRRRRRLTSEDRWPPRRDTKPARRQHDVTRAQVVTSRHVTSRHVTSRHEPAAQQSELLRECDARCDS